MSTDDERTDDDLAAFYDVPENRDPVGPAHRGPRPMFPDGLPVRLPKDLVSEIIPIAAAEGFTLSAWVRRTLRAAMSNDDQELRRVADSLAERLRVHATSAATGYRQDPRADDDTPTKPGMSERWCLHDQRALADYDRVIGSR